MTHHEIWGNQPKIKVMMDYKEQFSYQNLTKLWTIAKNKQIMEALYKFPIICVFSKFFYNQLDGSPVSRQTTSCDIFFESCSN